VDKFYAKKRQQGSPNSYIKQIPVSTSGTATNKNKEIPTPTSGTATNKNKEIPVSTSGTATNKNKEIPVSMSGTATNIEQILAFTTDWTNLFAGLNAEAQKVIDNMFADELAHVIYFDEQTKMPIAGILDLEDLLADKNYEPRWCLELGQPLVKPELVNKLPTKMRKFHDWYLKKSTEGLEMFGMLVRPGEFALQNEKVVWLRFIEIYQI
jgi:hypothetical protein